ncbi:MAG: transglycosylase domain-containing protein [Bacteroidetes bacterium]|nr:transglycosylase domain-containing protein [Bacteroidota bacterium]MDA1118940.1 transglycosylase domain-containing protein [Bacteroidota bacterium]
MSKRNIIILWIVFILAIVLIPIFLYSIRIDAYNLYGPLPSLARLENPDPDLSSELYSSDGVLLGKYFRYNRTPAFYNELSPELVETLLYTEDMRFWEHSGIDLQGLLRAAYGIVTFNFRGGGSTITMQLAENLYKTSTENRGALYSIPKVGSLITKLKEWIISIQLENQYTKEEIIALFLNTIEYGGGSYGIRVACSTYFNKLPSEINYQEAAILVGLINAPTRWNPVINPDNAMRKRTEVLYNLLKFDRITRIEFDSLKEIPIELNYKVQNQNQGLATYFRTVVGNDLLRWANENGYDLYGDGLRVYTTIDSRIQKYAENAVKMHMDTLQMSFDEHWKGENPWRDKDGNEIENFLKNVMKRADYYKNLVSTYGENSDSVEIMLKMKKPMTVFSWNGEIDTVFSSYDSLAYYEKFLNAGFMAMDPHTGYIKAWVGGIDHKFFKFDHVKYGRRQPGSTFKPFVYAAAIADGFSPCFPVVDVPISFDVVGDPPTWTPNNSNNKWSGETMTLRQAMAGSVNSITAWVMKKISPQRVVDQAKLLGIKSPLDAVPALCLGAGGDVSLYEMVGAYSAFVNKGTWTEPIYITKIEDKNGSLIEEFIPQRVEALSEETAYLMLHMLMGTTEAPYGTARGMDWELKDKNEVGAKTGTTQDASDGWFMGVTKDLVAGAWVGGDERSIHFKNWVMGQGGRTAMPIWQNFMLNVYKDPILDYEKGPFPKPLNRLSVEIDCDVYNNLQTNGPDSLMNEVERIDEDDFI